MTSEAAQAEMDAAEVLLDAAREGAAYPARPKFVLGVEGRGWAGPGRGGMGPGPRGTTTPAAWQAVLAEFSPDFVYEIARSRWRLAEALAEAGQRADAEREWGLAMATAAELGAAPLQAALDDLGRRARLGPALASRAGAGAGAGAGAPDALAGLTNREREVLRLLAAGRSNREIAAALFIAPKTASVHVSNIMAKLGAGSRTEAAAIALQAGLRPAGS